MKLIYKDAALAVIDKRMKQIAIGIIEIPLTGRQKADATLECEVLGKVRSLIDSLEVTEVNLEKEVEDYLHNSDLSWCRDAYSMTHIRTMLSSIAKHFFELGVRVQKGE